jgi:hypothetical protein
MKKQLIQSLALLAFTSPALADSFGVHLTYPLTIGVQYSLDNVFGENTALRFWGNAAFESSGIGGLLQVDGILGKYALTPEETFSAYYGLGGHVGFVTASSGSVSATGFLFGFQGTAGIAYNITKSLDVFLEGSGGYTLGFISGSVGSTSVTIPLGGTYYRIGAGLNFKL